MSEHDPERHTGAKARHGLDPAYAPDSDHDEELQSSTPGSTGPARASGGGDAAGDAAEDAAEDAGMGVSSERVGHTGPGQRATDGLRDVAPHERAPEEEVAPGRAPGDPEDNPAGIPPKAPPPRLDPRS
jgi:hypothetical protein